MSDQSNMTRSWGSEIASILVQTAGLLEDLPAEKWETASLCEGWSVRDVAGHILWRIGASTPRMLREGGGAYFGKHLNPMKAMDDLSVAAGRAEPVEIVRQIRHIAATKLAGEGRTGVSELTEALVHSYDIAWPLDVRLAIEPRVSHAVASARVRMPLPLSMRAAVAARTLRAADADWQIGTGPVIEGSAEAIVLFLFGRAPARS